VLLTLIKQVLQDVLPQLFGHSDNFEMIFFGVLVILVLQYARGGLLPVLRAVLPPARPQPMPLDQGTVLPKRSTPVQGQPLMMAEGLVKRFGGLVANKDMSLTVNGGEITALIGPNGAGKSTLFNLLSGVLAPNAGQIIFLGQRIDGLGRRAIGHLGVSRTFQHVRLLPEMSVLENVALGAHSRGQAGLLRSMRALGARRGMPRCCPRASVRSNASACSTPFTPPPVPCPWVSSASSKSPGRCAAIPC